MNKLQKKPAGSTADLIDAAAAALALARTSVARLPFGGRRLLAETALNEATVKFRDAVAKVRR